MKSASHQIRLLIKQINQTFFEMFSREFAAYGITGAQLLVIRCLKEPQRMSDIGKQLGLSNSSVCGIVDRLEENGYVHRIRDEKDRRVVWVHIGEKFEEIRKEVPIFQDNYFDGLLSGITEEEVQAIIQSLQLLANRLKEKVEEKKG
jgi:DNA-binding MarR family transcriptional regulator